MKREAYQKVSFREVMRITFIAKLCVRKNTDNYICANWICIWCNATIWIGSEYKDIPTDLRAYFLSPQQFEEYKTLCEKFVKGVL